MLTHKKETTMDGEFADYRDEFFYQCQHLFKHGVDMQDEAAVRKAWLAEFNGPDTRWKDYGWYAAPPWHLACDIESHEAIFACGERWLDAIVQEAKKWNDPTAINELLAEARADRRSIEGQLTGWQVALAESDQKIQGYENRIRALGGEVPAA
jgi:hypothetical protein